MRSSFLGGFESTTTSEGAPQRSNPRPRIARGIMDGGEITTAKRHPWTDGGPLDHKCNFDTPDISHIHIHMHTSIHPIHPFTWLICTIIQSPNHVPPRSLHRIAILHYVMKRGVGGQCGPSGFFCSSSLFLLLPLIMYQYSTPSPFLHRGQGRWRKKKVGGFCIFDMSRYDNAVRRRTFSYYFV